MDGHGDRLSGSADDTPGGPQRARLTAAATETAESVRVWRKVGQTQIVPTGCEISPLLGQTGWAFALLLASQTFRNRHRPRASSLTLQAPRRRSGHQGTNRGKVTNGLKMSSMRSPYASPMFGAAALLSLLSIEGSSHLPKPPISSGWVHVTMRFT